MKNVLLVFNFVLFSVHLSAQTAPNDNATSLRGHNGSTYTFTTTGTNDGSAWGGADGTYTDDSRLGKAAVHAGLLQVGQTGNVTITISSGRSSYQGSTRNGISTKDYGAWSGSYSFGATGQRNTNTNSVGNAPENMKAYRDNNGSLYTFTIVGTTDGNVWGGNNGIYTDDSRLSTAAVHAGIVRPGQTTTIRVRVLGAQSSFQGSSRNGVSTRDYGSWPGSYRFE